MNFDRYSNDKTINVYNHNNKLISKTSPKRAYKLCIRKIANYIDDTSIILIKDKGKASRAKVKSYYNTPKRRFCYICGEYIQDEKNLTLDHLVSKDGGGGNDFENLKPCCKKCNETKDNMNIKYFIRCLKNKKINLNISKERIEYLYNTYVKEE